MKRSFSQKSLERVTVHSVTDDSVTGDKKQKVLTPKQQDIYNAIVYQDFENLNTIVSKYFYSITDNNSDTIIIRKTMDVCDNDDLLKAHTKGLFNPKILSSGRRSIRQIREKKWPCCSLCGFPITDSDTMHIEHTIPSTLFYLLFTNEFFSCHIQPPINKISKQTFNYIMCNKFGSIIEDYRDIHLTICCSHDFCNQLKGRKVFINLNLNHDGKFVMSVNEIKIREFANGYLRSQTSPVGFMSSEIFNFKVRKTFIDVTNSQHMTGEKRVEWVFNKTRTFIQKLCDKYNDKQYNHASIQQNIFTLKNCKIQFESGELVLTELDGLNLEKVLNSGFYRHLLDSRIIVTENEVTYTPYTTSGRRVSVTTQLHQPDYLIHVPPRINNIRNAIEKDFEISEYIDSLIAKFQTEGNNQASGIRKNKTTKNKKNKNNKTKTRNKWMKKQRSKRT